MAIIDNRKKKEDIKEEVDKVINTPEETPENPTPEPVIEPEIEEEIEEVEEQEEPKKPEEKEELPPEPDYKEKFVNSTREAQVLASKNKKITEVIEQAASLDEPTDEEMTKSYPDWDLMTDSERRLAKDSVLSKKKFALIHNAILETKKVDEWVAKVDEFVEDPKTITDNPALEGKEADFRAFCLKPTRRGVDFEDLVNSFLFTVKPEQKHTGSLLETATGGPKENKPKELTVEEISMIRRNDPKKYKELIKQGKVKINF